MIRYQEDPPEDVHEDGQDPKSTEEENQWKKVRTSSRHPTSGHDPGHPAPGDLHGQESAKEATGTGHPASSPDIRPLPPSPEIWPPAQTSGGAIEGAQKAAQTPRTSGHHPGHPAPPKAPNIRPLHPDIRRRPSGGQNGHLLQPGHPALPTGHQAPREPPDIRPWPRTSDPWRSTWPGICSRSYRARTSGVQPGHPALLTGNPAARPDIRTHLPALPQQPLWRHPD